MPSDTLAIDFGTSNSAVAVLTEAGIRRIPMEHNADTLPTAVFFPSGGGEMQIGTMAMQALIHGDDGRYMRALKSVLGSTLMHESRLICGRKRTISDVITQFLIVLRQRAEDATGLRFNKLLSGRPVHFHSANEQKDRQAEQDLIACYLAAGFEEVSFLAEPEAAAVLDHDTGGSAEVGLIVDIGGGTSDFSVFRGRGAGPEIMASHGIRLGGTDFDRSVSLTNAMPELGLGGQLRRSLGSGLLPVPRGLFVDLATWSLIPFLYTTKTRNQIAEMVRLAVEPEKLSRLERVIEFELGHELAFAVERCKISVNQNSTPDSIDMGFVESGLSPTVSPEILATAIAGHKARLHEAAAKTIELAGAEPGAIERVILVGGSSLMSFVSEEIGKLCPKAQIVRSQAFTAVIDGLALATRH